MKSKELKTVGLTACAAAIALTMAAPAGADDAAAAPSTKADTKWIVRARVLNVIPDDSTDNIYLEQKGIGNTQLQNGVKVQNSVAPEVDITYMITPHIGVEAIAGMTKHDVRLKGNDPTLVALAGLPPGASVDNTKIFDTWVLPPTITLQYHFMPEAKIRPYAGFGVNYTTFLWDHATENLEKLYGTGFDINTRSSWGWAGQFGIDIDITDRIFFNVDVKYIDINTTASLALQKLPGNSLRVDLEVDPWVVGAGIGIRF